MKGYTNGSSESPSMQRSGIKKDGAAAYNRHHGKPSCTLLADIIRRYEPSRKNRKLQTPRLPVQLILQTRISDHKLTAQSIHLQCRNAPASTQLVSQRGHLITSICPSFGGLEYLRQRTTICSTKPKMMRRTQEREVDEK